MTVNIRAEAAREMVLVEPGELAFTMGDLQAGMSRLEGCDVSWNDVHAFVAGLRSEDLGAHIRPAVTEDGVNVFAYGGSEHREDLAAILGMELEVSDDLGAV